MSEILGYDCDGRPIRAGDRIKILSVTNERFLHLKGGHYTVIGPCPVHADSIEFDEPCPSDLWEYLSVVPKHVRRIPGDGAGDWSEIERATGWTPRTEVPA